MDYLNRPLPPPPTDSPTMEIDHGGIPPIQGDDVRMGNTSHAVPAHGTGALQQSSAAPNPALNSTHAASLAPHHLPTAGTVYGPRARQPRSQQPQSAPIQFTPPVRSGPILTSKTPSNFVLASWPVPQPPPQRAAAATQSQHPPGPQNPLAPTPQYLPLPQHLPPLPQHASPQPQHTFPPSHGLPPLPGQPASGSTSNQPGGYQQHNNNPASATEPPPKRRRATSSDPQPPPSPEPEQPGPKRKRTAGAASPPASDSDEPTPSKPTRRRKAKQKKTKTISSMKMTKLDTPKGSERFRDALYCHLNILFFITGVNFAPQFHLPSDHLQRFELAFQSSTQIDAAVLEHIASKTNHEAGIQAAHEFLEKLKNTGYSQWIRQIERNFLAEVFAVVYSAGLEGWHPDFQASPDSSYNLLHEVIALKTFEVLLMARQYRGMRPNTTFLGDKSLLRRFYRHFVFWYMRKRAREEHAKSGAVLVKAEKTKAYKRRAALGEARVEFAQQEGYPRRIVQLFLDPEAHSDDEKDVDSDRYRIKSMPLRSPMITTFIRETIDPGRLAAKARRRNGKKLSERERYLPGIAEPSRFNTLPPNAPLDWFEPSAFNALTVKERATYKKAMIALPTPAAYQHDTKRVWKTQRTKEFMQRFGKDKRKLYELPTAAEVAMAQHWKQDNGSESDTEYEYSDDENENEEGQQEPEEEEY